MIPGHSIIAAEGRGDQLVGRCSVCSWLGQAGGQPNLSEDGSLREVDSVCLESGMQLAGLYPDGEGSRRMAYPCTFPTSLELFPDAKHGL